MNKIETMGKGALVAGGSLVTDWAAWINWKDPTYAPIFEERSRRLLQIREDPSILPGLFDYYRNHPADFINDWGMTFDPRNADVDKPSVIPFILTPKQREWILWVLERWRSRSRGLCEKARDMGVTWLAVALAVTLCLFREGVVIGFGSRKAEYVDEIGTMKPILPKARSFMEHLPKEFRGDWESWRDAPKMRINFPGTGSVITGEAGDSIGRGDRCSIYFVDEAAHLERPLKVEASLSNTTRCRIDMSSVNGMANPFAQNRWKWNDERVFIFAWQDDPRKDDEWYQKQVEDYDPVVVAQEVDRDYQASVTGIVIPHKWVMACIDACEKLGIEPTGGRRAALDVADEGVDKNAMCGATGVEIDFLREWSGKGSDLYETAQTAVNICDEFGFPGFRYDADGLGAGIRGDVRSINEKRIGLKARPVPAEGWRGSAAVFQPEGIVEGTTPADGSSKGRLNKDYFANLKAQGWWALRRRVQKTFNWVTKNISCHPDEILSISSKMPDYMKLVAELSQPTYAQNAVGKVVINKKPDGMPSPNRADSAMILFAPGGDPVIVVDPKLLAAARALPRTRRH
jgi:phage terminase large subunit